MSRTSSLLVSLENRDHSHSFRVGIAQSLVVTIAIFWAGAGPPPGDNYNCAPVIIGTDNFPSTFKGKDLRNTNSGISVADPFVL